MKDPKPLSTITMLSAAALAGLLAGAGAPGCASAPQSGVSTASTQPGTAVARHPTEHHLCQGQNSCKGQDGTKGTMERRGRESFPTMSHPAHRR